MASDKLFVEFVVSQVQDAGEIRYIKLFGEYAIYCNNKLFGLICDNKLFLKPTEGGREFIVDVVEAPPYPGAKPSLLIQDKIEDSEWLTELVKISVSELPEPKPKRKKTKRKSKDN